MNEWRVWIAFVVATLQIADCCQTGRIFVGTVNETFSEYVTCNGIYVAVQGQEVNHRPLYRHEHYANYLYYLTSDVDLGSWVVGPHIKGRNYKIAVQTSAEFPDESRNTWEILLGDARINMTDIRAVCVEDSFVTCNTGRIQLSGLSRINAAQAKRTGSYVLTEIIHQLRPVYQHAVLGEYMFYQNGFWMIGPRVGQPTMSMFTNDYAFRPEYIAQEWFVFRRRHVVPDSTLKVTCEGIEVSEEEENEIDSPCRNNVCLHNSTCHSLTSNQFVCDCPSRYFGALCEKELYCDGPRNIDNGYPVVRTGHEFLDIAFYTCRDDYVMSTCSAVVCGPSGVWSTPPLCRTGVSLDITPIAPRRPGHPFEELLGSRSHSNENGASRIRSQG